MPVASIHIPAMADLVAGVERLQRDLPGDRSAVYGRLSYVLLSTESLGPLDGVLAWADSEIVGLRRRLALARQIQATDLSGSFSVVIDEDLISDRTPEQAAADAQRVAEALLDDHRDIPEDILELLATSAADPYFAAALAAALPPDQLADFIKDRESIRLDIDAGSAGLDSDREMQLEWSQTQLVLLESLGTAMGVAAHGYGELAPPEGWHRAWIDTISDTSEPLHASRMTLLMSKGVYPSWMILDAYWAVDLRDMNGDGYSYQTGADYWHEISDSYASYHGAMDPLPGHWGYRQAYDPMANLMLALSNNPDAAVEFFSIPGNEIQFTGAGGSEHLIDGHLEYLIFGRNWHGEEFEALVSALEVAAMPREGGSVGSALVAEDLVAVIEFAEEQQEIYEANKPPLWKRIGHAILDVLGFIPVIGEPADFVNAVWYAAEGDYVNAGLSAAGMIPLVGWAAVGGRWVRTTRLASRAEFDDLARAGRAGRVGDDDFARLASGTDAAPAFRRFADEANIPDDAIRLRSGTTGGWSRELNNPLPNQTYVVNDRFIYRTDAHGRVTEARGFLDGLPGGARNTYRQRQAGGADRLPDDQGGHIFARWFGGPGESINLVPMNRSVNGSRQMGALEAQWAELIAGGSAVDVRFIPVYSGTSLRPSSFRVRWSVDGGPWQTRTFQNTS